MAKKYTCKKTRKHGDKDGNVKLWVDGQEYELTDSEYKEHKDIFEPVNEPKKKEPSPKGGKGKKSGGSQSGPGNEPGAQGTGDDDPGKTGSGDDNDPDKTEGGNDPGSGDDGNDNNGGKKSGDNKGSGKK